MSKLKQLLQQFARLLLPLQRSYSQQRVPCRFQCPKTIKTVPKKPNKQQPARSTVQKSILTKKSKNHGLKGSFQNQKKNAETDEVIITIGNHLATNQTFQSEDEAQKVIDATDWNLVVTLIYACKEADQWEEKQKKYQKKRRNKL